MNDKGSVELALMLGFMVALQIGLWGLARRMSEQMQHSYAAMDPVSPDENWDFLDFSALGKDWPAAPPRVDFGADDQHERDAEALCYIVSRYGCAVPGKNFRCN